MDPLNFVPVFDLAHAPPTPCQNWSLPHGKCHTRDWRVVKVAFTSANYIHSTTP